MGLVEIAEHAKQRRALARRVRRAIGLTREAGAASKARSFLPCYMPRFHGRSPFILSQSL